MAKFDISWLEKKGVLASSDQSPEDTLLIAFKPDPNARLHVVDLAKTTGVAFDEALHGVMQLASRDYVSIVEREAGGDHLIELAPLGLQALHRS